MAFDNLCRHIAEQNPQVFADWLLGGKADAVEVLKTELSGEPLRADSVTLLRNSERILHIEFQTQVTSVPAMPIRMLDYWVRLYRRYEIPITQVVIFLKETNREIVNGFRIEETSHRFRVVKIWEQDAQTLLGETALLPLAVLAKTDDATKLLETVAENIQNINEKEKRIDLFAQTQVFAGLRHQTDIIKRLLRENFMKESTIYQEIIEEGKLIGMREGMREGLEVGIQQGIQQTKDREINFVLRQLKRRFGSVELGLNAKLEQLDFAQLEDFGEALLDFESSQDALKWFDNNI